VNAIFYIAQSGRHWRMLPRPFVAGFGFLGVLGSAGSSVSAANRHRVTGEGDRRNRVAPRANLQ
jgi:hypothetical protein